MRVVDITLDDLCYRICNLMYDSPWAGDLQDLDGILLDISGALM